VSVARRCAVGLVLLGACTNTGQEPSAKPATSAAPSSSTVPGVVAWAGNVPISAQSVSGLVDAQGLSPRDATAALVRDALFAQEATATGLEAQPDARGVANGILARALLGDLARAAAAAGPVTDEELAAVTERHWFDLDRPEGVRTVHAVVRAKPDEPEQVAAAKRLAERIAEAVRPAVELAQSTAPDGDGRGGESDPIARFKALATAVPAEGLSVVAEPLPAVSADGRVLSASGGTFDPAFASATAGMGRGALVAPVLSSFGAHVILGLQRTPAQRTPPEERRVLVRAEVLTNRALARRDELLSRLRLQAVNEPAVDALLALVPISP
jgi:parvulin-like peptidyl-prolyl isomerase